MAEFTTRPWDVSRVRNASVGPKVFDLIPRAVREWAKRETEKAGKKFPDEAPLGLAKLPYKEKDGTINVNAVKAAIAAIRGARGGVDLPEDVKRDALEELEAAWKRWKNQQEKAADTTEWLALDENTLEDVPQENRRYTFTMGIAQPIKIGDHVLDDAFLEVLAENTRRAIKRRYYQPAVKLEHRDSGPALGWVTDVEYDADLHVLFVEGEALRPDELPPGVLDLRTAILGRAADSTTPGAYPYRSLEARPYDEPWLEGHRYIMTGVALLGAAPPAVKGPVQDMVGLIANEPSSGVAKMTEKELQQTQAAQQPPLIQTVEPSEQPTISLEEFRAMQARVQAAEAQVARLREINARQEVAMYVERQRAAGRWRPLHDELKLAELLAQAALRGENDALVVQLADAVRQLIERADVPAVPTTRTAVESQTPVVEEDLQTLIHQHWLKLREKNPRVTFSEAACDFMDNHPEHERRWAGKV